jgi:hypothetical protein
VIRARFALLAPAALAFAALAVTPAAAQEAEPVPAPSPLEGVWSGTVGSYAVMACFESTDGLEGVYYYRSQLQPIALRRADEGAALTETVGFDTPTGATWSVERGADGLIIGQWDGEVAGKSRQLPIRLSPVAGVPGEVTGMCESSTFVAPRFADSSVEQQEAVFDGVPITQLIWQPGRAFDPSTSAIESFALTEAQPGDAAINAILRKVMPDGSAKDDFAACMAFTVAFRGWDGDYSISVLPELITDELVSVSTGSSIYCGGAHPSYSDHRQVFDRATGAEIDPSAWLKPEALVFVEAEYAPTNAAKRLITGLAPSLMEQVIANWPEAELADCLGEDSLVYGWDLGVERAGIVFKPEVPHVATVCAVPVVVRWDQLAPYLSDAGQALAVGLR